MDADFSHPPSAIPALRSGMDRADVCIGSRYIPGGGIRGWGWMRHFMSRGVNWYTRLFLRLRTKDNSGSYRCYRIAKLSELDFDRIRSKGYAFQEEILYRCRRIGCRFEETPIIFEDRRYGSSKINAKEVIAALWSIFRLSLDNLFGVRVTHAEEPKTPSTKSD
jgi:dolichol-phosphate mannosyltransferase